ncbi:MAG: dockerin type I domain-containing protein [Haloarculaceae archaeon]
MATARPVRPDVQATRPPVVTAIHRPRIDGVLYGHTGQALPDGKAGEWADAVSRDVTLDSRQGGDLRATSYVKEVDGLLHVALHVPQGVRPDEITRVAVGVDRDGSGDLTTGDLRFVVGRPLSGTSGRSLDVRVFRNGQFVDPDKLRRIDGGVVSLSPVDAPGLSLEAELNVEGIEERLGDADADGAGAHLDDETEEPGGYGIRIETVNQAYCTPICGSGPGVYDRILLDESLLEDLTDLPGIDIGLGRVEITQAVQKSDNSLRVVRDRQTLVRAFFVHNKSAPTRLMVRFEAWNVSGGSRTYLGTETVFFEAPPGLPDRSDLSDSANLELPASWTDTPRLELTATAGSADHGEATPGDNDATLIKRFVETPDLAVYRIRVNTNTSSSPRQPSKRNMRMVSSGLADRYPTSPQFWSLGWEVIGAQGPSVSGSTLIKSLDNANSRLQAGWRNERFTTGEEPDFPFPDQVYGIVRIRGSSDPAWSGGSGPGNARAAYGSLFPATMAHEINHNLGNNTWGRHVANSTAEARRGVRYGCKAPGPDGRWQRLFDDGAIHALGWKPGSGLVPSSRSDVMTYCGSANPRWVSDYRWELLIDRLQVMGVVDRPPLVWLLSERSDAHRAGEPTAPTVGSIATPGAERSRLSEFPRSDQRVLDSGVPTMRVVSGAVFPNGSGAIDPSFAQPGIAGEPPGAVEDPDALLRIVREEGSVDRIPLAVGFTSVEGERFDRSTFSVAVQDNGTVRAIGLVNADTGEVIDSRQATAWELEEASIRTPQQFARGQPVDVGVDVAGGVPPMNYKRLLYSPAPERGFWYPIGRPTTGDKIPVTFTELPGGDDARFLLLVSDGVATRFAVSDPFVVPPAPPAVSIERNERFEVDTGQASPPDSPPVQEIRNVAGPVTATVGAPVSIDARARDQHGGRLGSESVRWTATDDRGRVAATDAGRRFTHRFRTPGTYVVDVEVVDPETELAATDSIDVLVGPPPLPDADAVAALEDARDATATTPSLRFDPTDARVAPGRNTTVDVVVAGVDRGIGGYELVVNTSDASRARIVAATDRTGGTDRSEVAADGSGVKLGSFAGDTADTGAVTVATVTVRGAAAGTATLSTSVGSVSDERGTQYAVTTARTATVVVRAPEVIPGNPALDPDGDGIYEDMNGDGELTPGDATVLFNAVFERNAVVENNPALFDMNGDGELTPGDATVLFDEAF